MYKPPSPFRPHKIWMRAHLILRVTVSVGTVFRISHPRVVRIEHILPALRINHSVVQEIVGKFLASHAQFLSHLCHRHAVVRQEHRIAVFHLRLHLHQCAAQFEDILRFGHHLEHSVACHIRPRLSYRRQHLAEHPVLESLRPLLLRLEDAAVEIRLADESHLVAFATFTILVNRICDDLTCNEVVTVQPRFHLRGISDPQCLTHVGETRAEQQARLIAMPRRESFSASAKERRFLSISLTKLQMIWILCNCKIASVHDCAI